MNADEKVRRYSVMLILCIVGMFLTGIVIGNALGIDPTVTTVGVTCIIIIALAFGYRKSGKQCSNE